VGSIFTSTSARNTSANLKFSQVKSSQVKFTGISCLEAFVVWFAPGDDAHDTAREWTFCGRLCVAVFFVHRCSLVALDDRAFRAAVAERREP